MAKQKLNAAQRRARKAAEKIAQALYEQGKTPAAKPQGKTARRKIEAEIREEQRREAAKITMSSGEVSQLSKAQAEDLLRDLHDIAYGKYYRLMQQGTPNAATAIYENEIAGLDPSRMTINAMRAKIALLQRWIRRKDTSAKRAKRTQRKTLEYLKNHGFPQVTADDLDDFFDLYSRFLEYHGYGARYMSGNIASFASIYSEVENPLDNMQTIFERADEELRKQYESDTGDTFGAFGLTGAGGVQSPDAGPVAVPRKKQSRPARPPRPPRKPKGPRKRTKAQRRADNRRAAALRAAAVAARKKNKR